MSEADMKDLELREENIRNIIESMPKEEFYEVFIKKIMRTQGFSRLMVVRTQADPESFEEVRRDLIENGFEVTSNHDVFAYAVYASCRAMNVR